LDNCICKRHEFVIIKVSYGFIVHNTLKSFEKGHAHMNTYNSAISAVKLAERRELPRNHSKHFIQSLVRISKDRSYINRLYDLQINFKQLMEQTNDIDNRKCR
jgi:hypothetical protein